MGHYYYSVVLHQAQPITHNYLIVGITVLILTGFFGFLGGDMHDIA